MFSMILLTALAAPIPEAKEGAAGAGELKVLARGPWRFGVNDVDKHQHVVRSEEELNTLVGKQAVAILKALKVDRIDWKTQMLIVVSAGSKRTGGYRVEITNVNRVDRGVTVHWKLHVPTGAATQALTHPAEAVLVERFDGTVKFLPAEGKEG